MKVLPAPGVKAGSFLNKNLSASVPYKFEVDAIGETSSVFATVTSSSGKKLQTTVESGVGGKHYICFVPEETGAHK